MGANTRVKDKHIHPPLIQFHMDDGSDNSAAVNSVVGSDDLFHSLFTPPDKITNRNRYDNQRIKYFGTN
jgi:hypothetical protein